MIRKAICFLYILPIYIGLFANDDCQSVFIFDAKNELPTLSVVKLEIAGKSQSLIVDMDSSSIVNPAKSIIKDGESLDLNNVIMRFKENREIDNSNNIPAMQKIADRTIEIFRQRSSGPLDLNSKNLKSELVRLREVLIFKRALERAGHQKSQVVEVVVTKNHLEQKQWAILVGKDTKSARLIIPALIDEFPRPLPLTSTSSLGIKILKPNWKVEPLSAGKSANQGTVSITSNLREKPLEFNVLGRSGADRRFKNEQKKYDAAGPDELVDIEWIFSPFYSLGHSSVRIGNRLVEFTHKGFEIHGTEVDSARAFLFNNPYFKKQYEVLKEVGSPPFSMGIGLKAKKSSVENFILSAVDYEKNLGKPFNIYINNCNSCVVGKLKEQEILPTLTRRGYQGFSSTLTFQHILNDPNIAKTDLSIYPIAGINTDHMNFREMVPKELYLPKSTVPEFLKSLRTILMRKMGLLTPKTAYQALSKILTTPGKNSDFIIKPVDGLYQSIPMENNVRVGNIEMRTHTRMRKNFHWAYQTDFYIDGTKVPIGMIQREFSLLGNKIIFRNAEMKYIKNAPAIPNFLNTPGTVPLVVDRGIPTQLYISLMQMKMAGVKFGSLKHASVGRVTNVKSTLQLFQDTDFKNWLKQNPGKFPPSEVLKKAFLNTHTLMYLETALIQSGHRITKINLTNGKMIRLGDLIEDRHLIDNETFALTQDLSMDTMVPIDYAVELDLKPY